MGRRGAGSFSSCRWVRGGLQPWTGRQSVIGLHVETDDESHTHTHSHLQAVYSFQLTWLRVFELREEAGEAPRWLGENMQTPQKGTCEATGKEKYTQKHVYDCKCTFELIYPQQKTWINI